jgi:hypothetical protein
VLYCTRWTGSATIRNWKHRSAWRRRSVSEQG